VLAAAGALRWAPLGVFLLFLSSGPIAKLLSKR
jgi:hypothetical protein